VGVDADATVEPIIAKARKATLVVTTMSLAILFMRHIQLPPPFHFLWVDRVSLRGSFLPPLLLPTNGTEKTPCTWKSISLKTPFSV